MKQTIKQLKNAMAINDWNVVNDEFSNLNKQLNKAAALVAEEGVPTYYVACIAKIAELVEQTAADKDRVKKMSKTNAKSLNAMKQNIKKNNAAYETQILKYLENPDLVEEEKSESVSNSDSSSEDSGSESDDEAGEPEPEEALSGAESRRVSKILDWGLTEFTVPPGTAKIGMHFRLPPEPLLVHKVTEGSWADVQDIRAGDVVHSVAGKRAENLSAAHFVRLMMERPLKVTIERLPNHARW